MHDPARPGPPTPENRRGRKTNRRHASPAMKGRVPKEGEEVGDHGLHPGRGMGEGGGIVFRGEERTSSRLIAMPRVAVAVAANGLPSFYNSLLSDLMELQARVASPPTAIGV